MAASEAWVIVMCNWLTLMLSGGRPPVTDVPKRPTMPGFGGILTPVRVAWPRGAVILPDE